MSKLLSVFFLAAGLIDLVHAQSLAPPRYVQPAYRKGTRSTDGRPGPHYWQNRGRYEITIDAAPPDRTIRGTEKVIYINNSPDTLKNLVFRLIVNIHKPGVSRIGMEGYPYVEDSSYLNQGIYIDSYSENGKLSPWTLQQKDPTWRSVLLNAPLAPHDSIRLDLAWHYSASLKSFREGMIDSTTFFLAYSYPRIAVYDDYSGWDRMDFNDMQEFYNDFNDYILHVRVPRKFVVWATGTLQNPDEVLAPAYARKLAASFTSDSIIRIAGPAETGRGEVTAPGAINTWTWIANDITDMTFGLSDHYAWDASSVLVDKTTGRRVSVQASYNDTAADFHHMVGYGRHALDWYSFHLPGIGYPFPKMTIVQGYGAQEYPMMVNDPTDDNMDKAYGVTAHEIAHSYFPFYMGINESRYAFMDEGWATALALLIARDEQGISKANKDYVDMMDRGAGKMATAVLDLPTIIPSDAIQGAPYEINSYEKGSQAYLALKDLLGDKLFSKCLLGYMERWHGKHPTPWDFFYSFNDISHKNLDWFWNNWFYSSDYIDLAIEKVDRPSGIAHIRNIGRFAVPFDLEVHYTDGSVRTIHETPALWHKNRQHAIVGLPQNNGKFIRMLQLNTGIFIDADESNNKWTAK